MSNSSKSPILIFKSFMKKDSNKLKINTCGSKKGYKKSKAKNA